MNAKDQFYKLEYTVKDAPRIKMVSLRLDTSAVPMPHQFRKSATQQVWKPGYGGKRAVQPNGA
jgi:hypothetical protein